MQLLVNVGLPGATVLQRLVADCKKVPDVEIALARVDACGVPILRGLF